MLVLEDLEKTHSIEKVAKALEIPRSTYYYWKNKRDIKVSAKDILLETEVEKAFNKSKENYGTPRIKAELNSKGIKCSRQKISKIMKEKGLKVKTKKRFKNTTNSKHDFPVSNNLLERNFYALEPNKKWVSDITYIRTRKGWEYLVTIIDLFSRKVVSWELSNSLRTDFLIKAFNRAIKERKPEPGLIFHSDRGVQYASKEFRKSLEKVKAISSMSRKGNCWDNACSESFFSTLKREEVHKRTYETSEEMRKSIFSYIELFYNRFRIHSKLNYMSPVKFEKYWKKTQTVKIA